MCIAAAPLVIGGAALMGGASIANYLSTRNAMKQQAQNAMGAAHLQHQQLMMQSSLFQMQAGAMQAQSGAMLQQAAAYRSQADFAAKAGEISKAMEYARATQTQTEGAERTVRAAEIRRQLIGTTRTSFAANGLLLETRPQAAVAMWEHDEIVDLAVEMQGIKRAVDNEVFGYVWQGNVAEMQGLFDAASLNIQAGGATIEAGTAQINAAAAMAQSRISAVSAYTALLEGRAAAQGANAALQGAFWNMVGSLGGAGLQLGMFGAGGGFKSAHPTAAPTSAESLLASGKYKISRTSAGIGVA